MRRTYARLAASLITVVVVAGACADEEEGGDTGPTTAGGSTAEGTGTTAAAGGATTTAGGGGAGGGGRLDAVKEADELTCGSRSDLPGFAETNADGEFEGFDVDFCRAMAAGLLGDAEKATLVDVSTDDRLIALAAGDFDVLTRNTTLTASRDGAEGAMFLQPNYYDGQRMMVAADADISTLEDMDGATICVAAGTTTEGNVATEFDRLGLEVNVRSFDEVEQIQTAFENGQCQGWSSDGSQLAGLRENYPDGPESLVILEEIFSKEPLTPAVADGEYQLGQALNWVIWSTIQAEEYGITSENAEAMLESDDPNIVAFLGGENAEGTTIDPGLGLPVDFNYQIVSQVGNYKEIFERHLAPLGLERGINALWTDGGLMYAPPYR